MKRVLALSAAVLLLAPIALLAAVKTDWDHSVNFERYRTFAWKASPPSPSNGMINNSLVDKRIREAVDQQLMMKGMREQTQNPDVYLTYHIAARNRKDIEYFPSFGWGWRPWGWWGGDVFTNRYLVGSVVIDMIDAHTHQLVWRAYGMDTGSNLADIQSEKNVAKMVAGAFKHFPPESQQAG